MFFKKEKNNYLEKISSLLIHAAKIDENYTNEEKEIIKNTLIDLGALENEIEDLIAKSEINEQNSNQILDYTKEIKNLNNEEKIKIVESLWKIIYSNKNADVYETSLMRRIAGLIYIDSKTMGDIKEKIKKQFSK